jgi:hypothetical protein
MSKRFAEIVILCEDRQQEVFVRRYLHGLGYSNRRIRVAPYPAGRGSGEQFVRQNYPKEVKELRRRAKHLHVGLVVVIDADTSTVPQRLQQLDAELQQSGLSPRADDERIALLVPRRNIETWIHYLLGNPVDEDTVYPKLPRESDCQPAVARLLAIRSSGWQLPDDCPPSLREGCAELRRLE